jgi:hypothetical protein
MVIGRRYRNESCNWCEAAEPRSLIKWLGTDKRRATKAMVKAVGKPKQPIFSLISPPKLYLCLPFRA